MLGGNGFLDVVLQSLQELVLLRKWERIVGLLAGNIEHWNAKVGHLKENSTSGRTQYAI